MISVDENSGDIVFSNEIIEMRKIINVGIVFGAVSDDKLYRLNDFNRSSVLDLCKMLIDRIQKKVAKSNVNNIDKYWRVYSKKRDIARIDEMNKKKLCKLAFDLYLSLDMHRLAYESGLEAYWSKKLACFGEAK